MGGGSARREKQSQVKKQIASRPLACAGVVIALFVLAGCSAPGTVGIDDVAGSFDANAREVCESSQTLALDDEEDDEYDAKQRFPNSPRSKKRIIALSKRRKSARGKVEKTGIKRSRGQMRVQFARQMVIERWSLPRWRKWEVFRHSLLGL